jgi:ribonuclease VapC
MVCRNDRLVMIAVDMSALMAITLDESAAEACINALEVEPDVLISAGTLAEVLIVAARRHVAAEIAKLIDEPGFEVVPVSPASARPVAEACANWGKGVHPALFRLRGRQRTCLSSVVCWRRLHENRP